MEGMDLTELNTLRQITIPEYILVCLHEAGRGDARIRTAGTLGTRRQHMLRRATVYLLVGALALTLVSMVGAAPSLADLPNPKVDAMAPEIEIGRASCRERV